MLVILEWLWNKIYEIITVSFLNGAEDETHEKMI